MRIVVHDFGGYAFPLQLSRALAARGHEVRHLCFATLRTPRGSIAPRPGDPPGLRIGELSLAEPYEKSALLTRYRQERRYGALVVGEVLKIRPDVVLSANTPLPAEVKLQKACRAAGIRFVHWAQDLRGLATRRILHGKLPVLGDFVGSHFMRVERAILRRSHAVVLITDDFRASVQDAGVPAGCMHVIPNWAPLDEMPLRPRINPWSAQQGLDDALCFLYSGTLGMKHNPQLLLDLAARFRGDRQVRVVVVAEGGGAAWLAEQRSAAGSSNLHVVGFQPYDALPDVLGSADVLVAILTPEAAEFSVPSKVLSYLCAGRPVLLSVPPGNLAARVVLEAGAGLVAAPEDAGGFSQAAERLRADASLRREMGRNARRYAETHFDIRTIAAQFEAILLGREGG